MAGEKKRRKWKQSGYQQLHEIRKSGERHLCIYVGK